MRNTASMELRERLDGLIESDLYPMREIAYSHVIEMIDDVILRIDKAEIELAYLAGKNDTTGQTPQEYFEKTYQSL